MKVKGGKPNYHARWSIAALANSNYHVNCEKWKESNGKPTAIHENRWKVKENHWTINENVCKRLQE